MITKLLRDCREKKKYLISINNLTMTKEFIPSFKSNEISYPIYFFLFFNKVEEKKKTVLSIKILTLRIGPKKKNSC